MADDDKATGGSGDGSGAIRAAPEETAAVDAGVPRIDRVWTSAPEVRCGDPVELHARVTAAGYGGAVYFKFTDARSGDALDPVGEAVGGRTDVKRQWGAAKPAGTWDADPDLTLKGQLVTPTGDEVNVVDADQSIRIVRPENAISKKNIASGSRRTPQWVQNAATGVWAKNGVFYEWKANYALEFKDGVVLIIGRVKLIPQGGLVITAAMKKQWKAEIERYWNGWYAAHRKACVRGAACECEFRCCRYPLKIVCDFVDSDELTRIKVHPGACAGPWGSASWWYSDNWYERWSNNVPRAVRAHEFGHNIGLYDEYKAGGIAPSINPNGWTEPTASIMNAGTSPMPWHYNHMLASLGALTKDKYVSLKNKTRST